MYHVKDHGALWRFFYLGLHNKYRACLKLRLLDMCMRRGGYFKLESIQSPNRHEGDEAK